eukprot:10896964-Heterocapsa_arctica.AAC.1
MAWKKCGEEDPGIHVRYEQEQLLRVGATWRNLNLAPGEMGSTADGSNVLEHDPPHEERQGVLQQLHDQ